MPGLKRIRNSPAWPFVAPFATLMLLLGAFNALPAAPDVSYPVRTVAVAAVLLWFSSKVVTFRATKPWSSVLFGVAVFLVWIGPDLLWPAYRESWLFRNALTGDAHSHVPPAGIGPAFLFFRVAGSVLLVPVVEELFWRAFLMRWLISKDFLKVPLGTWAAGAFWITAVLFASEHGPYWDVGLLAGIAYNWWAVRTRNLADCILAHAGTNGCLAAYVIAAGAWQYWL